MRSNRLAERPMRSAAMMARIEAICVSPCPRHVVSSDGRRTRRIEPADLIAVRLYPLANELELQLVKGEGSRPDALDVLSAELELPWSVVWCRNLAPRLRDGG